jgi:hypothetical protein
MSKNQIAKAERLARFEDIKRVNQEIKRVGYAFGGGSVINVGWKYRQQMADIRKHRRNGQRFESMAHIDARWSDRGRVWDSKEPEFVKAVPMPETLEQYLKRHQ